MRRRSTRRKVARIDVVLRASEIDVFAGYAEDLFHGLSDMYEDMKEKAEEIAPEIFYTQKEINKKSESKKALDKQLSGLKPTAKMIGQMENAQLFSAYSNFVLEMESVQKKLEIELEAEKESLELLEEELAEIEGSELYGALGDLLKDLDQDDSIEGLTSFANTLTKIMGAVGSEEFIEDILGNDSREFLIMIDKIGG